MADSEASTDDYHVLWLDKDVLKNSQHMNDTKTLLRSIVGDRLQIFNDPDECVNHITEKNSRKVIVIVSNTFGCYIVELIHELPQIESIYVFCMNQEDAKTWAKSFAKVRGIYTHKNILINKIRDHVRIHGESIPNTISVFHLADHQSAIRNLTNDSADFMWYQLVLSTIERLPTSAQAKQEMINECRVKYQANSVEQEKINRFTMEYTPSKAIWWYTYDSFLYRLLNLALRTHNIDIIFRFRFFIRDLNDQIKMRFLKYLDTWRSSPKTNLTVYRGQRLSIDEIKSLQENINGLLSMNTFLSATSSENVALIYAETNSAHSDKQQKQSVLFIIRIFDIDEETAAFARVDDCSCHPDEKEILFSVCAIFRIQSVVKHGDRWHVILQLTKQENKLYRDLYNHIIAQVGSVANPLILGWFLYQMGDYDKADRYINSLIEQHGIHETEIGHAYNLLGLINKAVGRPRQAVGYYERALENFYRLDRSNRAALIATHYNIGLAYLTLGDEPQATYHQEQATKVLNSTSATPKSLIWTVPNRLKALLQTVRGEYSSALINLESILEKRRELLPKGHPTFVAILKDMGIALSSMGKYQKAISCFHEALHICSSCLSEHHIEAAECHKYLGIIYYNNKSYKDALKHFQKALDTLQAATRDNYNTVCELTVRIENTKSMIKRPD